MDSLNISTGEKRIAITRDGQNVGALVFNPADVLFAEKFYKLIGDFQTKLAEYKAQAKELDADKSKDENDLPSNMQARIDLIKEACEYTHNEIDYLFGAGTSLLVFNGSISLEAVNQFLEGITPYIQTARVEKIQKYTNKKPKRK